MDTIIFHAAKSELRSAKARIDDAIARVEGFEEIYKHTVGIEHFVDADFESESIGTWVAHCYLMLKTDLPWRGGNPGKFELIEIEQAWLDKTLSPDKVLERLGEMAKRRGVTDIRFDPTGYVFIDGRYPSWWRQESRTTGEPDL